MGTISVGDPESIVINLGTISAFSPSVSAALTTVTPYSDYVSLKLLFYINITIYCL